MKKLLIILLLVSTVAQAETYKWTDKEGTVHFSDTMNSGTGASSAESRPRGDDHGAVAPQVEDLKGRMMKDEGTMSLIRTLQDDPQMQALLSNPAILGAIQAGDVGTLLKNPDFMKLLDNPRVREIERRMQ